MDAGKAVILVVDEPDQLVRMNELLRETYQVKLAGNAREAQQLAQQLPIPELIVQAGGVQDRDGTPLSQLLKADLATFDIPILAILDNETTEAVRGVFAEGAVDYLVRPLQAQSVLARVAAQVRLRQQHGLLADQGARLEALVVERTAEVERMQDATILAVASLAETRDSDTCFHIRRTQTMMMALARHLQQHPRFCGELTDDNIALLYRAAPLHDVGKMRVPDAILLKPGRLTSEEFEVMKLHTVYGRDAIIDVEHHLGGSTNFLRYAREIAYSHQEKWDGSGYPLGLAGDAIPMSARLMAVADVYDAMISKRVYKPAFTHETAIEFIRQGRGEHFDPDVADAMLEIEEEVMAISARFADPP
jgi:putative two-component system response regulator